MLTEDRLRRSIEHARAACQFAQQARQRATMLTFQTEELLARFDEMDRRAVLKCLRSKAVSE